MTKNATSAPRRRKLEAGGESEPAERERGAPPSALLQRAHHDLWLAARRITRCDEEARDIAQEALLVALDRGVDDWGSPARRAWLRGVVRKRAAFLARSDQRRRRRERALAALQVSAGAESWAWQPWFLASLPPSLRSVAALASLDLSRLEIRHVLGLTDTALRARLSALRRVVRSQVDAPTRRRPEPGPGLGARRAALLAVLGRHGGRVVATHDPDGHTIFLRMGPHDKAAGGNCTPGARPTRAEALLEEKERRPQEGPVCPPQPVGWLRGGPKGINR